MVFQLTERSENFISLTGSEIVSMYLQAISLIKNGVSVAEAHASIGVLPGSKLHDIMCGDIQPFIDFPNSKVSVML